MKPIIPCRRLAVLAGVVLLLAGCATSPSPEAWRYLQRPRPTIAVLPAANRTTKVGAQIIIDKAWEDNLVGKSGFGVVGVDAVVTYASARSIPIAKLTGLPTAQLGQDLHADFLLEDEIVDWGTKYKVIKGGSFVACRSRLIEARTGATVWAFDWLRTDQDNNNSQQNSLLGVLVKSVVDSMFDQSASLANQGVEIAASLQPYPGMPPAEAPPAP